MSKELNKNRLKLRIKLDRPLDALLHNKEWRKYWKWCQDHNINYYLHMGLVKFFERKNNYRIKNFNLYAIGQSHLDACWLWTKLSTIRRAIITFQQAVDHFKKYSYFTFSQTTPQYYEWVKNLRPDLFKKIQEYEKKNRWEIVGGMWVEPDTNLANGESLVRQRLYGQIFYLENFGKFAKIECLEDTFGFNAQLPQILTKSGAEAFWTTKITWNDYSEFPFANFVWRGLDGSEIFTHMFLFNWLVVLDLSLYKRTGRKIKEKGLIFDSSNKMEDFENALTDEQIKTCGIFYGFGDGGMGPWIEEIDIMTNIARAGHMKFCTTEQYFQILQDELGGFIPIWDDELYLEYHRGVYTSQAETKRLNRLCEINMRNCEIILSLLSLIFKEFNYPHKALKNLWKDILFNQFHDILPGSSIQDVYYEQEAELQKVVDETNAYIDDALKILLKTQLKVKDIPEDNMDDYILIFNTLPWNRDGYIKLKEEGKQEKIKIENMDPLSFQVIKKSELLESSEEKLKKSTLKLRDFPDKIVFENRHLSFTIDKKTGKIVSLIHKEKGRQLIKDEDGIGVHVYKERKTAHPAWEIYSGYTQLPVSIGIVKGIKILENNKKLKRIKIIYKFQNSQIDHFISLRRDSFQIDFQTNVDVHDKYLLFKTRFPFKFDTNKLHAEIPYGYLERKIIPETKMEKGKWEFPAQKYVDISDNEMGISIINNSKYGFSSNEKGVYLTLVHTPPRASSPFFSYLDIVPKEERTKYVDIGLNKTRYAIKIHENDFKESKAWRYGYEFNYPLLASTSSLDAPKKSKLKESLVHKRFKKLLKANSQFIKILNPNIILQAIKPPEPEILEYLGEEGIKIEENSKCLIMRFFETSGEKQENVTMQFHDSLKIKRITDTDLLEREMRNEESKSYKLEGDHKINLNFDKFEIKTLKIVFQI